MRASCKEVNGWEGEYCFHQKGKSAVCQEKPDKENEIAYLMGEMDLEEAAAISGCSPDAFRKSLERRKSDFRNAMKAADCR